MSCARTTTGKKAIDVDYEDVGPLPRPLKRYLTSYRGFLMHFTNVSALSENPFGHFTPPQMEAKKIPITKAEKKAAHHGHASAVQAVVTGGAARYVRGKPSPPRYYKL
ncbi:MAG: hypothetical protein M1833_007123 [Piccolia ochrophora]|nr:MAG: hypothetical protein M1833_007123 [Piccolia ochrophora]